jgi:hypothetical protein
LTGSTHSLNDHHILVNQDLMVTLELCNSPGNLGILASKMSLGILSIRLDLLDRHPHSFHVISTLSPAKTKFVCQKGRKCPKTKNLMTSRHPFFASYVENRRASVPSLNFNQEGPIAVWGLLVLKGTHSDFKSSRQPFYFHCQHLNCPHAT